MPPIALLTSNPAYPGRESAADASLAQKDTWWAHQDLNLEPTDYEFSDISVSL